MILKGRKMGNLGTVLLILFIVIRALIAVGIGYLVFCEVRKSRKRGTEEFRETNKDANRKDVDNSSGGGD